MTSCLLPCVFLPFLRRGTTSVTSHLLPSCFLPIFTMSNNFSDFLSPTETLGGFSDEPGVCSSSVRPSIRTSIRKHFCPLNNLNTVWNVLMILHSYVEQVMTMCRVQIRELLLYYFLSYLLFDAFFCIFVSALYLEYPLEYNHDASQLCRTGHDNMSHTRMTISLSYFLSYFPLIVADAVSFPLHNLNTL